MNRQRPEVPQDLLLHLMEKHPERSPRPEDDPKEAMYEAGAVNLVRYLITLFEQDNPHVLLRPRHARAPAAAPAARSGPRENRGGPRKG